MPASLASWLRPRPQTPRPGRTRLAVEPMEDRTVPSSVSGVVFNDLNRSGVQDAGDGVFAGWTVYLDPNRNGVLDAGEPTTVTDAAGGYQFDTTNAPAWVAPTNGNLVDFVTLDLPVGEGGRYMNTTATVLTVNRTTTPDTTGKNFGAYFQPFAGTGLQPVGTETLASETTAGAVTAAAVAADAAGNYTVAWKATAADGTGTVVARVFNANGTPRTGQFTVATGIAANVVGPPAVAMSRDGSKVVFAWQNFSAANQSSSTSYRVYTGTGSAVTAGAVSLGGGTATTSVSLNGVAADATGNAVILYKTETYSKNWGWSTPTLKAQRVTASGAASGSAITVASLSLINGAASVAMDGAGRFVVVYDEMTGNSKSSASNVFAQCYTAGGAKSGGLITVATGSALNAGYAGWSSVAMNASGRFVVAYGMGPALRARVFNFGGTPVGSAVDVSTDGYSRIPAAVAIDDGGNSTFTWTDERDNSATPSGEVRIKRLSAAGVLGAELIVDTTTQGEQSGSAVAATGAGTVVTVWVGYGLGDDSGVFMQQYGPG